MLIDQIKEDMWASKKTDDMIARSLLTTLFAEASRIGKDRRNGPSTDDEVIGTVKKFVSNTEETIKVLSSRNMIAQQQVSEQELVLLQKYMPVQLNAEELQAAIAEIVLGFPEHNVKMLGKVMADMKAKYGTTYDGKLASEIARQLLSK